MSFFMAMNGKMVLIRLYEGYKSSPSLKLGVSNIDVMKGYNGLSLSEFTHY